MSRNSKDSRSFSVNGEKRRVVGKLHPKYLKPWVSSRVFLDQISENIRVVK